MNILCIGDIVGKPGRTAVARLVPELTDEHNLDLVIANAENAAGGTGLTPKVADELFSAGCDVLTLGDHVWAKQEIKELLSDVPAVLRPANFPPGAPGKGWCITTTKTGIKIGVINLLGRVFMRYNTNCPFQELKTLVAQLKDKAAFLVVDIHAEATSEKIAFGLFADGKVAAVFGTHTHVQTADERILPQGTAYITDVGMTGPHDSVIGQDKERIIERFTSGLPVKFQVASGDVQLHGVVIAIDEKTGMARQITRIQRRLV